MAVQSSGDFCVDGIGWERDCQLSRFPWDRDADFQAMGQLVRGKPGDLDDMVSTPVLFIYGELLPKHLFYLAPYRLLKITGPLFLVISIAIAPITIVLYGNNLLIQRFGGGSAFKDPPCPGPQRITADSSGRPRSRAAVAAPKNDRSKHLCLWWKSNQSILHAFARD